MGCDIHLYVEKRVDGKWVSADQWEVDPAWPDEGARVPYAKRFYTGRNYDLFAILANVRNGYGFAGVKTGGGFVFIDKPRGMPEDVSPEVAADAESWGCDGHSHSFFTLAELLVYDWTQVTKHQGYCSVEEWDRWTCWGREQGEGPREYCGGVGGGGTRIVTAGEMDAIVQRRRERGGKSLTNPDEQIYALAEWEEPYYRSASGFWSETIPRLLKLAAETGSVENVRIVFFFDN
jgi:hypothetical protein